MIGESASKWDTAPAPKLAPDGPGVAVVVQPEEQARYLEGNVSSPRPQHDPKDLFDELGFAVGANEVAEARQRKHHRKKREQQARATWGWRVEPYSVQGENRGASPSSTRWYALVVSTSLRLDPMEPFNFHDHSDQPGVPRVIGVLARKTSQTFRPWLDRVSSTPRLAREARVPRSDHVVRLDENDARQGRLSLSPYERNRCAEVVEFRHNARIAIRLCPALKKEHVRGGVPTQCRPVVWQVSCGARHKMLRFPDRYHELLSRVDLDSEDCVNIEKDIGRTFPSHEYFRTEAGMKQLRDVLAVFAQHNPDIGYCQSLNFVAAMLLIHMGPHEAFWMMVTLTEDIFPDGYYTREKMPGANADQSLFMELVREKFPEVNQCLEESQVPVAAVFLPWFACLFITALPPTTVVRVLDVLFFEGSKVLFRVGMALLRRNEAALTQQRNLGEFYKILGKLGHDEHDADDLLREAFGQRLFTRVELADRRRRHLRAWKQSTGCEQ